MQLPGAGAGLSWVVASCGALVSPGCRGRCSSPDRMRWVPG
jgi:hypothetical protein